MRAGLPPQATHRGPSPFAAVYCMTPARLAHQRSTPPVSRAGRRVLRQPEMEAHSSSSSGNMSWKGVTVTVNEAVSVT